MRMVIEPVFGYLCWAFPYMVFHFVVFKARIERKDRDNQYKNFLKNKAVLLFVQKYNIRYTPITFQTGHFILWQAAGILAIV